MNHSFLRRIVPLTLAAAFCAVPALKAAADTVLPEVGPKVMGYYQGPDLGTLRVYTATEAYDDGELNYYPHTSYTVYRADGSVALFVRNHLGNNDESPETVQLPAGKYRVKADSESDGRVIVPVVVKGGHTTVVSLEKGRESDQQDVASAMAVKSPSGQVVGWRAK